MQEMQKRVRSPEIPWRRKWQPTPVFLPGESHGQRSLEGSSPLLCIVAHLCPTLCDPMDCSLPGFSNHGDSPGKNNREGSHALLQGIFPTQGSNPGSPALRRVLYRLSHQGSSLQSMESQKSRISRSDRACRQKGETRVFGMRPFLFTPFQSSSVYVPSSCGGFPGRRRRRRE